MFILGGIPEPLRALMEGSSNPEMRRLRHEAGMAEDREFWAGLSLDQTQYFAKILRGVMNNENPAMAAASLYGNAEMVLQMKFAMCVCGEKHRDLDALKDELLVKSAQVELEKAELDLYNLVRREQPFEAGEILVCSGCEREFWHTLDERKAVGGPGREGCPGCNENKE